MKILVLNGSPKGKYSITLQTVLYLEKRFPQCEFKILHVGQQIKRYQKDITEVLADIVEADLLLFSYPVYTFIAPYQLHRFIELVKESGVDLNGKFATQITTSKHFYDVTAHKYIEQNCGDMNLRYIRGLSSDMDDLLTKQGQKDAECFWNFVLHSVGNELAEVPKVVIPKSFPSYTASLDTVLKSDSFETVIVTNKTTEDNSLGAMIEDFRAVYPHHTKVVNIAEYPFSGGCLGCFNCAVSGKCIYKDNFDEFLRNEIQTATAIVFAFSIKDHSMGASFKQYDDRQFCNGHRTVTMGMPMAYIIRGDYENEFNLQMIIEARCEVGGNFLCGVATDRDSIIRMSQTLSYAIKNKLTQPANFYGVGGMKIFRDLIWLMRGMMKADHKFYKSHGLYDFPQKKHNTIIKMKLVGTLLSSTKVKSKMGNKMNEGMIAPYKKVVDEKIL
jgi:multimeric flavodoxin WrbA